MVWRSLFHPLLFTTRIQQKVCSLQSGREPLPDPDHAGTLILDFQSLKLWELSFCCLQATQFVLFCSSSLSWWRHKGSKFNLKKCWRIRTKIAYCRHLQLLLMGFFYGTKVKALKISLEPMTEGINIPTPLPLKWDHSEASSTLSPIVH